MAGEKISPVKDGQLMYSDFIGNAGTNMSKES